ncbi:D-alanine--D-alanine ligase family protein [Fusibacter ferrireducens]|uniref:D-alanine--D-alanine ligase n=1 Tax=Fusibacter ferrireducens TaxID=2785058 RepID=A0ABR9ZWQ4_9FIRM|nr:D-alanine--D-alanine ligase family protein [Fusibacter ferrireducens]MBF4694578.1 D-alanine--D-alanine ligase [Fusibacter ferrireducens]
MINIGVFFGGTSVEHEVAVITAQQAISQLLEMDQYKVIPIYISKDNNWYTGDYLLEIEHFRDLKKVISESHRCHVVKADKCAHLIHAEMKLFKNPYICDIDIAFPIIHGTGGEDGNLQGFLEHMDIPYVGCNVLAASLTMDKIASKLFLQSSGIRVVEGEWFYTHYWNQYASSIIEDLEKKLSYPMIVKPADIGSSVGVKTAKTRSALIEAIDFAKQFSTKILVEKMLDDMREINISVLGDSEKLKLSVCEEPLSASEFLTYEDKYINEAGSKGMSSAKRQIPAHLSESLKNEIEHMAAEAFIALDCAGVSRIDFMIDQKTNLPYINEFNTIPGSLSFYLWEATHVTFKQMLEEMIDAAYRSYRRKNNLIRVNSLNILSKADLSGIKK